MCQQPVQSVLIKPEFSKNTGIDILDRNRILILTTSGAMFEIVSPLDFEKQKLSSLPQIKLNRKTAKTPLGGLLSNYLQSQKPPEIVKQEKTVVDNKKLHDLLYLPGSLAFIYLQISVLS